LVAFFATMALGGGFGGRDALPPTLATIGEHLPYGAAVEGISAAWMGSTPDLVHLGALTAAALVAGLLAARLFRWE
jgi:ABC-2 type transport system permease protein